MSVVEFKYGLICDSIRKEYNGKYIFIGVYTGDILMSSLPGKLKLDFWVNMTVTDPPKDSEMTVQVIQEGEERPAAELKIGLGPDPDGGAEPEDVSFVLPNVPFTIESGAAIVLRGRYKSGKWINILRKPVGELPRDQAELVSQQSLMGPV
ncbi:MAG: hypothetical protein RIA71_06360 [Oceanicaulis sp.]